ncbi:hypothetical protein F1645_16405 (plasmid) [Novacetimonas hansenii]|uniref:Uncharacterized protein n=1 Tax=Novacetimonas hansenii TaxID=436 RepID=A0ABQ0SFY1_NOVHA|nr:hypothetical protein [Novacetimonas hansenii]GAN83793.1 hypothetical protein Gaha_0105_028 [Novacetimonas hansenii JCM 7643]GBQ63071.1 hypothetical protein AA0243_3025 [Novacetimonas hansenii NRIC 0243]GEC64198.1 hypothetical protein GHA01_20470 [Novacetimonas hansenii]
MSILKRLLGRLTRAYDVSPRGRQALSFGAMLDFGWELADDALVLSPSGRGTVTITLTDLTVMGLAMAISAVPGFFVLNDIGANVSAMSALRCIVGTGSVTGSAGYRFSDTAYPGGNDCLGGALWVDASYPLQTLTVFTSDNWGLLDGPRAELQAARDLIRIAPNQMAIPSAEDDWLNYLGAIYGNIARNTDEPDVTYGARIISTILRPACNNKALELAIEAYSGQSARVTNSAQAPATSVVYGGTFRFDGSQTYDNPATTPIYGLFDIAANYDTAASGVSPTDFRAAIIWIANSLRAAGTYLRNTVIDNADPALTDADPVTSDSAFALTEAWNTTYDGVRKYDGSAAFRGEAVVSDLEDGN